MKIETYNRLVTWFNDTNKALGSKKVLINSQDGIEYIMKRTELETIGTIIEILKETEFKNANYE